MDDEKLIELRQYALDSNRKDSLLDDDMKRMKVDKKMLLNVMSELKKTNLTVKHLRQLTTQQDVEQITTFSKILKQCHQQILQRRSKNFNTCIFKVPAYTFGVVPYCHEDAIQFVVAMLHEGGFHVSLRPDNRLLIQWE